MKILRFALYPVDLVYSFKGKISELILFGYIDDSGVIVIDRSTNPKYEILDNIAKVTDRQRSILYKSLK